MTVTVRKTKIETIQAITQTSIKIMEDQEVIHHLKTEAAAAKIIGINVITEITTRITTEMTEADKETKDATLKEDIIIVQAEAGQTIDIGSTEANQELQIMVKNIEIHILHQTDSLVAEITEMTATTAVIAATETNAAADKSFKIITAETLIKEGVIQGHLKERKEETGQTMTVAGQEKEDMTGVDQEKAV